MNYVFLIGRLTKDPDLRITKNGKSTARMTLAVDRDYKNKNGERETDFIPIVTWGSLAETCAMYLEKGKKICVIGKMEVRSYIDKEIKKYITEVIARDVRFLEKVQKKPIESLAEKLRTPF